MFIPVPVTTIDAVPRVTEVFWKSMLDRSPSGTLAVGRTRLSLLTGALSPVSAASWTSSVADRTIRPSAGTMSPASTWTRSPGTTSTAGTSTKPPLRTTLACGTCRLDKASTLARALSSCREPNTTLSRISNATITPVDTCPMAKLTTVTAMSMMFIGSRSWVSAILITDGGFSPVILFGPYRDNRDDASEVVRPVDRSDPSPAATSAASTANGVEPPLVSGPIAVPTSLSLTEIHLRVTVDQTRHGWRTTGWSNVLLRLCGCVSAPAWRWRRTRDLAAIVARIRGRRHPGDGLAESYLTSEKRNRALDRHGSDARQPDSPCPTFGLQPVGRPVRPPCIVLGKDGCVSFRSSMAVTLLVMACANVATHRFPGGVTIGLTLTAALAVIARASGLGASDLGLARATWPAGLRWGTVCAAVAAVGYGLAYVIPATRDRGRGDSGHLVVAGAMLAVFVVIPLGTVLPEEFAFRGVLWGLLRRRSGRRVATLVSSGLFGLWHVAPALGGGPANQVVSDAVGGGTAGVVVPRGRDRCCSPVSPACCWPSCARAATA